MVGAVNFPTVFHPAGRPLVHLACVVIYRLRCFRLFFSLALTLPLRLSERLLFSFLKKCKPL